MQKIDLSKVDDLPVNINKIDLEFVRFAYIKKDEYAVFRHRGTNKLYKSRVKR